MSHLRVVIPAYEHNFATSPAGFSENNILRPAQLPEENQKLKVTR